MDEQMADRWYRGLVVRSGPLDWVIEFEGRCIGTACLHSVDDKDRRAAFAIAIFDPDCVGRGLGTEATNLALGHAFDTLGLHRVSVRVLAYNERAIACYQKCGFTIEGRERESARVGDDWHDDLIMGVLSHEWAVSRGEEPRR